MAMAMTETVHPAPSVQVFYYVLFAYRLQMMLHSTILGEVSTPLLVSVNCRGL